MMSKLIFVILIFLSGCATVQGYKDSLQTWLGHSDSELFQKWGQPRNSFTAPDGKTILEYHRERTEVIPGYTYNQAVTTTQTGDYSGDVNGSYSGRSTTYIPQTTPSEVVNKFCDTRFTISNHTVVAYSFNGNDCVSFAPKNETNQDAKEALKLLKEKKSALCSNPEYKIILEISPCNLSNLSLDKIADNSKITPEQKTVIVKYRSASSELDKDYMAKQRLYGGINGGKLSELAESFNPVQEQNDLELYEGKKTWGEYLQKRKDLNLKFNFELKRISQH